MKTGKLNAITDVPGVLVGHETIVDGDIQTGVTAILPKAFNWFKEKNKAAVHVINGFGKSIGLTQIEELYNLETPILLTNTLSAPHVADCLIKFMLRHNPDIGGKAGSVNPVVLECNDSYLNNIRRQMITEHDVFKVLNNASETFERGAVGAGRGMSCYQLKGGIGTASRLIELEDETYVIGCLVMTNMGLLKDLRLEGKLIGPEIQKKLDLEREEDKGSIIIVLASNLPLESHQLKRMIKRAGAGLARTGTYFGHGSGDIVLGFTTETNDHYAYMPTRRIQVLHDQYMDRVFDATAEVVEASIIDSLMSASEVVGFNGNSRKALKQYLDKK
jgi:D-aminopeptidase